MKIKDISNLIEETAPLCYQESYDNSGLIIGHRDDTVKKILLCTDVTEEVLDEAINKKCNLIISHHPPIFNALKKLNGTSAVDRIIIKAIQHTIALYAAHTNLDNAANGVSRLIADKIGLSDIKVLSAMDNTLRKLVTFCPTAHSDKVRNAIFNAGAGHIGNYDCCSYNVEGKGSFRASDKANPFVGEKNITHFEPEARIETIFPVHLESQIIKALLNAHPYEEVAYDIYKLENKNPNFGSGVIGKLNKPVNAISFLKQLKKNLKLNCIKHSALTNKNICTVAVCGGAGSFLTEKAIAAGADLFISSEFRHNQFVDYAKRIILSDIGHYEGEQYVKELIKSLIIKKFPKFAVEFSAIENNPVSYL